MAIVTISESEFEEFMTSDDPYAAVTAELNSAQSLVAAAARHGYRTEAPRHWTERLDLELESAPVAEVPVIVDRPRSRR